MVTSSSSVMPSSLSLWNSLVSSFFHRPNRKFSGVSTAMNSRSRGAENMANASGDSLARLLGEISPKMSTTTVSTMVDTAGPSAWPMSLMNSRVDRVAATLLTMLLPMRMVESSLS